MYIWITYRFYGVTCGHAHLPKEIGSMLATWGEATGFQLSLPGQSLRLCFHFIPSYSRPPTRSQIVLKHGVYRKLAYNVLDVDRRNGPCSSLGLLQFHVFEKAYQGGSTLLNEAPAHASPTAVETRAQPPRNQGRIDQITPGKFRTVVDKVQDRGKGFGVVNPGQEHRCRGCWRHGLA